MSSERQAKLRQILKQYWSFPDFRLIQLEVIEAVLSSEQVLAIMPTGGGKSLCYQVPALYLPNMTLVISPLLALMKDQVASARRRGINAVALASEMSQRELIQQFDAARAGKIKLLYMSPERLQTDLFQQRLGDLRIDLVAVDEAHCISEWGHDFRPAYRNIGDLKDQLPDVPFLALSASATPQVQRDIASNLRLGMHRLFSAGFKRPNLGWILRRSERKREKMLEFLFSVKGSALVYTQSRRSTRELARLLQQSGLSADAYHAGLSADQKDRIQSSWTEGQVRILCCTSAFGMGIDKADVRGVLHWEPPESLEAYYQQSGRAGRDGKAAWGGLLCSEQDYLKLKADLELFPDLDMIRDFYQQLADFLRIPVGLGEMAVYPLRLEEFLRRYAVKGRLLPRMLKILEQNGWIRYQESDLLPSRLQFIGSREDIYRLQIEQSRFEELIKTLQRTIPGLHDVLCPIDEYRIATQIGKSPEWVKSALAQLQKMDLVDYQAKSENPQIQYLRARVSAKDLLIDRAQLDLQRQAFQQRMQAMLDYLDNQSQCRSRFVLAYFEGNDQTKANPHENCGRCDWCRENDAAESSGIDQQTLDERIRKTLSKEGFTASEILLKFEPEIRPLLGKRLKFLLDEGLLNTAPDGKLNWSSSSYRD
jgi:ATP-dependent DNA helicase RecQ